MGRCVTVNTKGTVNNGAGLGMRQKWGAANGFIVFFVVGSPPPALIYVSCPPHLIPDDLSLFSLLFHFHMYYCEHKLKSK